jgi:uncharacterized membrane protein YphA (DoxX/SURF4 family)
MERETSNGWNIATWVAQVILALLFGMAGVFKTFTPMAELATKIPWTAEVPAMLVRFIGVSELLGAIGILLPAALRIRPRLTPLAAAGLALVMALAILFHLARGEAQVIGFPIVLGALAAFVAWSRSRKVPVQGRA